MYSDSYRDRIWVQPSTPPIEPWREVSAPINASVALVAMVNRSSQAGGIAAALESWQQYVGRHSSQARYTAVLLTRYDLHWKTDLTAYLGAARFLGSRLQEGIGFLWREVNAEYGHPGQPPFPADWRGVLRVPDTAHVFSTGYYADCFLRLVKAQHFRQDQLHHVYEEAGHLLEDLQREAGQVRYLVERGPFDSNPCRVHNACFLNPLYELLPRDDWIVSNGVCQEQADFLLDEATGTLCCPSPDNCCPNTDRACERAGAAGGSKATPNVSKKHAWSSGALRQRLRTWDL